jgi:hypothetical protein
MPTSQTLEALRALAYEPATHAACYKARRLLHALPHADERAEAERYLLGVWGEPHTTLQHLIERHAFGLALGGVDLSEPRFTQGSFTFHVYIDGDPVRNGEVVISGVEALPEPARRRDLKALLKALTRDELRSLLDDIEEDELDELTPFHRLNGEERAEALMELGLDDLVDNHGTVFPCVVRAESVEELIREVRRLRIVTWFQEDEPTPPLRPKEAHLQPIEDPDLLSFARELYGNIQLMGLSTDLNALYYCRHILLRRPGAELLFGWDAIPHRQSEGWAILRWG